MNLALLDGLINGLGDRHVAARMDPQPGQCCVAIGRAGRPDRIVTPKSVFGH
jgi:hypothetical protein